MVELNFKKMATFDLYKYVQQKNQDAEDELIFRHGIKCPNSSFKGMKRGQDYDSSRYREILHIMYLHLTK